MFHTQAWWETSSHHVTDLGHAQHLTEMAGEKMVGLLLSLPTTVLILRIPYSLFPTYIYIYINIYKLYINIYKLYIDYMNSTHRRKSLCPCETGNLTRFLLESETLCQVTISHNGRIWTAAWRDSYRNSFSMALSGGESFVSVHDKMITLYLMQFKFRFYNLKSLMLSVCISYLYVCIQMVMAPRFL